MQVTTTVEETRKLVKNWKKEGKTIGLVPTMGFLHEGHASLIRRCREENDIVVVSDFVNPTQFGPNEDYGAYPRDLDRDSKIAEKHNVDVLFAPEPSEMYAPDASTWVEVPEMSKVLCGVSRPIHFRGVCTVCTKLFMLTQADYACFGEKDWQQQAILRRMVRDLFYPVKIVPCPIVRAEDGLALSSRNVYLDADERKQAPEIYAGLKFARELVEHGETSVPILRDQVLRRWAARLPLGRLDYLYVVDPVSLEQKDTIDGPALMACAIKMPHARLIDNILLKN